MKKTILLLISVTTFLVCGYYSELIAKWERVGLEGIEVTAIDIGTPHATTVIVVGTKGKGIYLYDEKNSKMIPLYTAGQDSFETFIQNIHSLYINSIKNISAQKILFAGSDNGLYTYNPLIDPSKWTKTEGIPQTIVTALCKGLSRSIFASTYNLFYRSDVYRSDNYGESWKALKADSVLPYDSTILYFTSIATKNTLSATTVYASSKFAGFEDSWSGVIQSNNLGETWSVHNGALVPPASSVYSLCFYRYNFADTVGAFAAGTDKGVFTYTEPAISWSILKPGVLDNQKVNDLHVTTYSNSSIPEIFACTDSGAYLLTAFPDGDFTNAKWHFMNFKGKTFCAHAIRQGADPTNFWYVGTDDGLYKCYRNETPIEEKSNIVKLKVPYIKVKSINNNIIINYHPVKNYKPNIKLLNSKGKILINAGYVTNSTSIINTGELCNGIYFLHFRHGNNSIVKKISIIK